MLSLRFVTSDTVQEIGDIQSLKCILPTGPVKILPHHAPMIAAIEPGKIYTVKADGIKPYEIASGGLLKVERGVVTIVS